MFIVGNVQMREKDQASTIKGFMYSLSYFMLSNALL